MIAEDSAVVARVLMDVLSTDPEIEVVGVARDGTEAVAMAKTLKPDLITMDVRMPKMDGLMATRKIMEETPTPIVIVSASVNVQDMNITFEALRAGALDIIEKPRGVGHKDYEEVRGRLVRAVKLMSEIKVVRRWPDGKFRRASRLPKAVLKKQDAGKVVLIGASTGGPAALEAIFSQIPASFPAPILVVQHIAPGFIHGLVEWLSHVTALKVKIAETGETPLAGTIYFAGDNFHFMVDNDGHVELDGSPPVRGHRPSIDRLFSSAALAWGGRCVGVLLTGMGTDGVEGLRDIRLSEGKTIAQDEATSVIFGMPKEAIAAGIVEKVASPNDIGAELIALTS